MDEVVCSRCCWIDAEFESSNPSFARPCPELVGALRPIPAVEECHSVAGELSMLLKVRVTDTVSLLKLTERVRKIPGIEQTHTTIVMESQFERPTSIPQNDSPSKMRG
jgi:DNA-binding Lrp family transcriptional regulator